MVTSRICKTAGVVALAAGALLASSSAATAAAEPQLAVSPSTGLTDGQQVTVTATGFLAGDTVGAVQCSVGEWPNLSCDLADAPQPVTTDSDGNATMTVTVRAQFAGVDPVTGEPAGNVDCTSAPGCSIRGGSQTDPTNYFAEPVPISFG